MNSFHCSPCGEGCPIRISPGQSLLGGSPRLVAACHVLHRFSIPRHPPCALNLFVQIFTQIGVLRMLCNCQKTEVFQNVEEMKRRMWVPQGSIRSVGNFLLRGVSFIPRKEVIQPQVPLRLPCYDLTPIIACTLAGYPLAVSPPASGTDNFRGLTGGVYKARERIHRGLLIRDY